MRYARGVASREVPARASLVGNPSDMFGGATIAFTLDDLRARVVAEPGLKAVLTAANGTLTYAHPAELRDAPVPADGALALLWAAAKRYFAARPELADRGVSLTAETTIPARVGLGGSSAIILAALGALGELFGDEVPPAELPALALACEAEELEIVAGPQDRVVQTLRGLVFMDFDPRLPGPGRFDPLDPRVLPPLFVAWREAGGADSGALHAEVLRRYEAGEKRVVAAMDEIAGLARRALPPLLTGDPGGLGVLLERNFELRQAVYELDPGDVALVEAARDLGAPANYAGSGGAIVGLFRDEDHLIALRDSVSAIGCDLLVLR